MPNASATSSVILKRASETMQETIGPPDELDALLISVMRLRSGPVQFCVMESQRAEISCVALISVGGSPSGIVSNLKSGKSLSASGPLDLSSF
ncbi:hypothetical protein ACHQM5_018439 [Ranunculus cassubicifolius]